MQQAVETKPLAGVIPRARLDQIADGLAIALAVSLPWSSSATSIFAALWLLAVLPTLDWARLREIVLSPAGGLPIVFTLLALLGILWSQAPFGDRFASVVPFARMLAIPLLMCQFVRSPRGPLVLYALLASCTVLLILSYWVYAFGGAAWNPIPSKQPGVPVKDYIVQSGLFTICAFALIELAAGLWQRRGLAIGLLLLSVAFLVNIAMVVTGRTAILVIGVLLVLFALRRSSWKTSAAVLAAGIVLAAIAWAASPYLRERVTGVITEVRDYQNMNAATSSGQRLELWSNAIKLIARAPVIGYGTGALAATFRDATQGDRSIVPNADNPHNQTFTVGIQLGLLGVAVLYALWLWHLLLFRGGGWAGWVGMVVVAQSVVGSMVNSYLFDFTPGWTYVVCVGVAGGLVLRQNTAAGVTDRA